MRRDSKLSSILHVLLHMAQANRPFTSEELSSFLDTNPVLVRRVLAGLRERGYVGSGKGHGGGQAGITAAHDDDVELSRQVLDAHAGFPGGWRNRD